MTIELGDNLSFVLVVAIVALAIVAYQRNTRK